MNSDPLMTVLEVADHLRITPSSWRANVASGDAPAADDPDTDRPANRRRPRWRRSTIDEWNRTRRRAGRPHQDPSPVDPA
ncbi:hypothetical protein [Frankia sp. ACN1ag]|uniref:hypothetical protein n=1 Tax=Frankia sp. ACN1ag TaxID=102891 RepID=UPI0006DC67DC|nr:hypothetical protein [Frankia sp. ACN1ag]KQC34894.1 hypothetical protein UK82_29450 [Frankia sp. ACN1ag]